MQSAVVLAVELAVPCKVGALMEMLLLLSEVLQILVPALVWATGLQWPTWLERRVRCKHAVLLAVQDDPTDYRYRPDRSVFPLALLVLQWVS